MTAIMADEEALGATVPFRASSRTVEIGKAQREAAEAYRRVLPILQASVRRP